MSPPTERKRNDKVESRFSNLISFFVYVKSHWRQLTGEKNIKIAKCKTELA